MLVLVLELDLEILEVDGVLGGGQRGCVVWVVKGLGDGLWWDVHLDSGELDTDGVLL